MFLPRAHQCLGAVPGLGHLLCEVGQKLPGHPVLNQAQPSVLREPKHHPEPFPACGMELVGLTQNPQSGALSPAQTTEVWLSCRVKLLKTQIKLTPVQNWVFPLSGCSQESLMPQARGLVDVLDGERD